MCDIVSTYMLKNLSFFYSVAIAMIGNPSVVILDEPTSGMDNNARQMTWNLLRDKAATNGTTILVSTHSM